MTQVYLALSGSLEKVGLGPDFPWASQPLNALISFAFIKEYRRWHWIKPARLMLDSGAYSAWKSGKSIDLDSLTSETKATRWHESICLDVIGDPARSLANAHLMKSMGSPAYPVFHIGDPWEHLDEYRLHFPKVGLSCRFGEPAKQSVAWVERCFARAWPYRFHSFGWLEEPVLDRFPFDSADSANWRLDPLSFGKWKFLGRRKGREFRAFSKPIGTLRPQNCRAEVEYYQRLQRTLEGRWRSVLATVRARHPLPSEKAA